MKKILLSTFVSFSLISNAQIPDLEWAHHIQSSGTDDMAYGVTSSPSGEIIQVGKLTGGADFDPGGGSTILNPDITSAYIHKLNSSGDLIYAFQITGLTKAIAKDVVCDSQGNIIVIGTFEGVANFDLQGGTFNLTSSGWTGSFQGPTDFFIAKYDSNGSLLWAKSIGGFSLDAYSISIDSNNDLIISGEYWGNGQVDFDPGPGEFIPEPLTPYSNGATVSAAEAFILKLNNNGDFIWCNVFGDWSSETAYLKVDANDNIVIVGTTAGSVDVDPGANDFFVYGAGSYYGFYAFMWNSNGDFMWGNGFGRGEAYAVDVDLENNILITGIFKGNIDFDPGPDTYNINSTDFSTFILKLTNSGELIWVKNIGGESSWAYGIDIFVDNMGCSYILGITSDYNNLDLDPGSGSFNLNPTSNSAPYLIKLNSDGDFVWALNNAVGNAIHGRKNILIQSGGIYTIGYFSNTIDIDPSVNQSDMTSQSGYNIFIQKLSQCSPSQSTISEVSCEAYTAPDGQIYTQSGTYSAVLSTVEGCDSIITIELIINPSLNSTITESSCDTYTAPDGQIYTENGTYTAVLQSIQGCDSTLTIELTINSTVAAITQLDDITLQAEPINANYQWVDCDNNYEEIDGATNQIFIASYNSSYAAIVSQNGCTDTSQCITISKVGIDNVVNQDVLVYPNPTSNLIHIKSETLMNNMFVIFDQKGREVISGILTGKNTVVPLGKLANGIYNIQIEGDLKPIVIVKD